MNLKKMSPIKRNFVILSLMLPLLLAIAALVYLRTFSTPVYGSQPSPPTSGPIFLSVVIFTIGYFIFMLILFWDNIMDAVRRKNPL
jgi:hypothetical protein